MRKFFSIFAFVALALGFASCDTNEPAPDNKEYKVELSADTNAILADGEDKATFTVKVDGAAASEGVQIICLNDNSVLEGTTFATTTDGEYRFKAAYKGFTSETVTIIAVHGEPAVSVVLSADKSEILADNTDTATLTVTVNGEDKTDECKITIVNYGVILPQRTFTSDVAGEFVFEAEHKGHKSEQITIVAKAVDTPAEKKLTIATDKTRIKADGQDKATLTVSYGDEDVTSKSEIYVEQGNVVLEDATFSTTAPATYTIRAKYNGMTSTYVTIDAYDPNLAEKYEVGSVVEINGVKGIIFAIKGFPVYNEDYTEVIGTDQYCYVFSMDEEDLQWSTKYVWCNCMSQRGDYNSSDPFNYWDQDINDYPAFKWCKEHGEGWFLPSSTEMNWMWEMLTEGARDFTAPSVAKYNELIVENGGEPFCETYYWSSNETSEDLVEVIAFMNDSVVCLDPKKDNTYTARAAYRFKAE